MESRIKANCYDLSRMQNVFIFNHRRSHILLRTSSCPRTERRLCVVDLSEQLSAALELDIHLAASSKKELLSLRFASNSYPKVLQA